MPDDIMERMDGYKFERLAGADRYATNIEILNAGPKDNEIVVCTGSNYVDSLFASAIGNRFCWSRKSSKPTRKRLELLRGENTFYIIGGTGAVAETIEIELKDYGTVKRISGSSRYDTSVEVAKEFFPEAKVGVLVYGENFPDGLCGGAIAFNIYRKSNDGGPLLLTKNSKVQIATVYTKERSIMSGVVLGGA